MKFEMQQIQLALAVAGAIAAAPAGAITISNGSFEDVVIVAPFTSGNLADVPGWIHGGVAADGPLWRVGYNEGGGSDVTVAGQGQQFVTLGGGGIVGSSSWSQNLSGFVIGNTYRLDFMMSGECGPGFGCQIAQTLAATIDQGVDASQSFTETNIVGNYWEDWKNESMTFVADATSLTLSFAATTQFDVGLDDVSITSVSQVPVPMSAPLLAAGLLGLTRFRRRSR